MSRATFFFKKLITLAVSVFIFFMASANTLIPLYVSIATLNLAFALISTRISGTSPKELYNFHRNEKYFTKGGMRDLLRIPVMLFSFLHDIIVWEIWGLYQVFEMLVDIVTVIKEAIYWIFFAIVWFFKILVPFWRISYRFFVFYLIKWPWWIFTYAYQNMRFAFKWNMLRIALPGAFITLLTIQSFFSLDIWNDNHITGITFIGFFLALLPITWVLGEIASVRAQELEDASFAELKPKFRNGIESVRGILTFQAIFVVLAFIQIILNALGWIPKADYILLGVVININLLINIVLLLLAVLITVGTFILPNYRLYHELNETNLRSSLKFISFIGRRILQFFSGFIPSSFFSVITIIPITILVSIALFLSVNVKNGVVDIKINHLNNQKADKTGIGFHEDIKIKHQIQDLEYIKRYPTYEVYKIPLFYFQELKHKTLLKNEIENDIKNIGKLEAALANYEAEKNPRIAALDSILLSESQKAIPNQTRIDKTKKQIAHYKNRILLEKNKKQSKIDDLKVGVQFKEKRLNRLPLLFYLSGIFYVVIGSFIFTFLFAYWGNFYYSAFVFRNDGKKAEWRKYIADEQQKDYKQPLLSTTINIIIICAIIFLIRIYQLKTLLY